MINILRQINLLVGQGVFNYVSEVKTPAWKGVDIPDKYKLVVPPGYLNGGFFRVAGSTTQVLTLPELYLPTERLFCLVSAFGQVRVTTVHPVHGNSVFTLNGSDIREAVATWNGRVTSISVTTPTATAAIIRYSFFQMPDLNEMDSFRGGVYNFGVNTNNG